jgi:hypothetical protein
MPGMTLDTDTGILTGQTCSDVMLLFALDESLSLNA